MRIIKFRGKDDSGTWVKGSLVCYQDSDGRDVTCIVGYRHAGLEYIPVDPETVGQFTVLHDKDGRDIYEGDVVECVSWNEYFSSPETGGVMEPFRRRMQVVYRLGAFKLLEPMPEPLEDHLWDMICDGDVTIVGNIHDNPDILKEGIVRL